MHEGRVVAAETVLSIRMLACEPSTLFAREHNRIVAALPANLPAETKFEIARRILGAEEQYITYTEFLPALGVQLPAYRGYNPTVNPGLSNEFAIAFVGPIEGQEVTYINCLH